MTRVLAAGISRLCLGALAALFLVLVAVALDPRTWPFELINHFVFQYLLGASCLCLIFVLMGRKALAGAALMLALAFAADYQQAPRPLGDMAFAPVGPANASVPENTGLPSHRLSLITSNLSDSNHRHEDVGAWLATQPAEVVVLQEIPDGMASRLRALKDIYHFQFVVEPGARLHSEVYAGEESMAVLSIHPITARGVLRPSGQGKLALMARLSVSDAEDPWIVVVHPSDPVNAPGLSARDAYISDVAEIVAELAGPVIIAGDFNATPYAPAFGEFLGASRTSTFRDFPATWPAIVGPLGISINHVLVREARLTDLEALPSIGSDHRGLKAELLLPAFAEKTKDAGNLD